MTVDPSIIVSVKWIQVAMGGRKQMINALKFHQCSSLIWQLFPNIESLGSHKLLQIQKAQYLDDLHLLFLQIHRHI